MYLKKVVTLLALILITIPVTFAQESDTLGKDRSALQRLQEIHLQQAREDVEAHQAARRELPPLPGLHDFRAILHAHAEDSDHTGGTRPEMLEDAKTAGVDLIMLTDHFRPPRDFMDSWRGERDGVLFIPGSEAHGFLLYPETSILEVMSGSKEEVIEATTEGDGLIFLSHVEERMDHPMDQLTGMEIYNRHHDAADDMDVLMTVALWATDPVKSKELEALLETYPHEVLAVQVDYPADYLAKWDRDTQQTRVVGIAANDCHHNQVFIVKKIDDNSVRIGTVVDDDEEMRVFTAEQRPGIPEMTAGHQPGDILVRLDFDPYVISFHNVSTHVLAPELTEQSVRDALAAGHAYVAHDWMADPSGSKFYASRGAGDLEKPKPVAIMGDEVKHSEDLWLNAEFPVNALIRVLKDGKEISRTDERVLAHRQAVIEPGVYRVEAWLQVDDEDRLWVYSNPIYVR